MITFINHLYNQYHYITEYKTDPRTKDWLFVGSFWYLFGIIGVYLQFIYVSGPAFMKKRKPFELNKILQLYNVIQIILNGYIFVMGISIGLIRKSKFICLPIDYSNDQQALQVAFLVWLYYIIKIFDLLNTIFFVLRKKQNQVTFLHTYHHTGMVIITWIGVRYLAGGQGIYLGFFNSFVHTIMYSYYLWTSLKLGKIWWKKYITQLQLLQFVIILLQFSLAIFTKDCGYPKLPILIFMPHLIFIVILFTDFYYKSYIKK
ncbi:elongation of very long chain fatty acids protein AAEL008004-like [Vespa velutina]|uniref:elongation of very long chain fatty acids protein AAEL008004-like n=1 Tax=Vespa velutina TaxID=202808 RepID=UPI001FB36D12|nr:elongation of very long chain fatty acids protein AAEL008004-like [Vespa velutina]